MSRTPECSACISKNCATCTLKTTPSERILFKCLDNHLSRQEAGVGQTCPGAHPDSRAGARSPPSTECKHLLMKRCTQGQASGGEGLQGQLVRTPHSWSETLLHGATGWRAGVFPALIHSPDAYQARALGACHTTRSPTWVGSPKYWSTQCRLPGYCEQMTFYNCAMF